MQIVIDIPDKTYKVIKNTKQVSERECWILTNAISNSKSLPKGHGRLIDADYLREDFKTSKKISFAERMDISCIVDHAPTIIEADKEE